MTVETEGRILVTVQFFLIGVLLVPGQGEHFGEWSLLLFALGIGLGVATLTVNRPGNFNIRPALKKGARLITRGPYRWIRHPMYTALLLLGAGVVLGAGPRLKTVAWLALALVLYAKARLEERALRAKFPDYADYASRTARFLPFLV